MSWTTTDFRPDPSYLLISPGPDPERTPEGGLMVVGWLTQSSTGGTVRVIPAVLDQELCAVPYLEVVTDPDQPVLLQPRR